MSCQSTLTSPTYHKGLCIVKYIAPGWPLRHSELCCLPKTFLTSAIETPAGKLATALHVGPYERLGETHAAIHAWADANKMTFAGKSWEIYGDWSDDPAKLETRVEYLLP
jgi:hypothetical protein